MKILNFGSCNIDFVYSIDHIVNPGETERTSTLNIFPGGKGLNQSIAVARAGAKVYHAGCIGTDGEMLKQLLEDNGVDVTYLKSVDAKNGHAIIQVSSEGENSIFLYPGSNEMITTEYIDTVLEGFEAGDIIILQNEISNVKYIIERAYEKNMCIIFNPSPMNERISEIDFNMISYVLVNTGEAKEISSCETAEESIAFFRERFPELKVVITLGKKGCMYIDKDNELYQSSFNVKVVDTTGAGDTFTGYFVAELAAGNSYAEILKLASAASSIAVSRNGAAPSIPDMAEVKSTLKYIKANKDNGKNEILLERIDTYVQQNIKDANLADLASILGYSSVYTGNLVKNVTGLTFSKLLQCKRCEIAADKLLTTDMSVEEIIESIGYENESFFRKIFKERYGANPLEYRKRK
ncbi:MAG: helix-turn-helix domain-containing protein [Clostridia bacterium]|nr:helix-turn-helix domain-containing protein [Clostridia bacterium]